ncbi:MAG: hypothetical protein LBU69_05835 [Deltaproteobacteria bacterium]|nr:hypothetical protein [Deltaproteobacteria bacterium]
MTWVHHEAMGIYRQGLAVGIVFVIGLGDSLSPGVCHPEIRALAWLSRELCYYQARLTLVATTARLALVTFFQANANWPAFSGLAS